MRVVKVTSGKRKRAELLKMALAYSLFMKNNNGTENIHRINLK